MRCAIWYHLYNFKNVRDTHGGVLILVKLQASATCNLYKLYKWHRIAQRINGSYMWNAISKRSIEMFYVRMELNCFSKKKKKILKCQSLKVCQLNFISLLPECRKWWIWEEQFDKVFNNVLNITDSWELLKSLKRSAKASTWVSYKKDCS